MSTGAYLPVEETSGVSDRIKDKNCVDADQEHTNQTSKQQTKWSNWGICQGAKEQ